MEGTEIPGFGEILATFRTRVGLSQQKVASALGMSRRAIAAWEAGENLPKAKGIVLQLARLFKLNDEEATTLLKAAGIDPRLPIWNIPFPQNPFFTGRDHELEQLHAQLHQRQTAVVGQAQSISGLGGIGKTQLAIEYAYHHHDSYQYVLWARAESVEALTSSFTEMTHLLNLSEKDEKEQAITIQAVKRWLQRQRSWLLILDNADNPALLHDFLPPTVGGHLLITTRAAEVSAHLTGLAHPLVVDTFSDEQGALFLLHRSNFLSLNATLDQAEPPVQELALSIARELGNLPLALDQAGAYLKATGCSLNTYQQLYRRHRALLLTERRGADHPEPVATTWNISFRNVERHDPAAADLLRLCAFLAPDAIPEVILTKGAETPGPVFTDAYRLNEAIEALRTHSLITRDHSQQTLTVHRMVQAVLRDAMDGSDRQIWAERAIKAVCLVLPAVEHRHWSEWELVLVHALACSDWIKQLGVHLPEATELLQQTGWYLTERARYVEAKPLVEGAYWISHQERGAEHLDTTRDAESLAYLYTILGKYEQAEPLYQHALAIHEQQLGPTHLRTATSLNNLALLYGGQGKYEQAEPLHQRALAICEQQLGPEHPHTASSLNNLASLFQSQGKYEQAEPLYQRALAIDEQQLGPEHPHTANSLNNLAYLYYVQDKHELAEPLYRRALSIREQQLGPTHPDTAQSLNNLAALSRGQGKFAEAELLYRRTLSICEQQLGPEHPHTANSLNNLAYLYQSQGKYEQAEPLYQSALAIHEQQLGSTHPQTATSLNNLANLYYAQGKYVEAEPLLRRALSICEQQLGVEHPLTQTVRGSYATLLQTMSRDAGVGRLDRGALISFHYEGSVLQKSRSVWKTSDSSTYLFKPLKSLLKGKISVHIAIYKSTSKNRMMR